MNKLDKIIKEQGWDHDSMVQYYHDFVESKKLLEEFVTWLENQAALENSIEREYTLTPAQIAKITAIAIEVEMAGDGETTFSAKEAAAHVDGLTVHEMLERMGYWTVGDFGARRTSLVQRFGFYPETGTLVPPPQ